VPRGSVGHATFVMVVVVRHHVRASRADCREINVIVFALGSGVGVLLTGELLIARMLRTSLSSVLLFDLVHCQLVASSFHRPLLA
jgi:hypothetical protein